MDKISASDWWITTKISKISASVQQISHQVVKILTTCHLNVFSPTFISISTGLACIFNLDEILWLLEILTHMAPHTRALWLANTELYYIYLEIGLLYFRQSKKCGKKHGGRRAFNDVKRVILRHNFMKYTTDRLRTVGKPINSPPWL